jgi:hypothetical protein
VEGLIAVRERELVTTAWLYDALPADGRRIG